MKRFLLVSLVAALTLPGCDRTPPITPLETPCPSSASAEVEAEPVGPALTAEQRSALDRALAAAVGLPLAQAVVRFTDVEHPAWGRRLAARARVTAEWCAARE